MRHGSHRLVLLLLLLLAAPVSSAQGAERTAGAAPVLQEHGEANDAGYSCSTGIVIRWAHVKGIDNYTLTFYDGLYQSDQSLFVSPPYDDKNSEHKEFWAPKGTHQKGWTGGVGFGFGSPAPPCKADPGYYGRVQNPKVHWTEPGSYIEGTVTRSCPFGGPIGNCGVQGVKVQIRRTGGARAAAKKLSDSTDRYGNYAVKVAPGSYEVKADKGSLKFVPKAKKVKVKKETAARADFAVKENDDPKLSVKVVPEFPELNVDELPDGTLDPASTKVEVTVANTGKGVAKGVKLGDLGIQWDVDDVKPPKPLPLVQLSGPDPADLGDIDAGESVTSTYAVEARGDGRYELTARATGTDDDGKKLSDKGSAKLKAQSPILFVYTRPDRSVPSPDAPELIKAGTALAIRVRLRNRSYRDTIVVHPFQGGFTGNLVGGYLQPAGKPIQDAPNVDDIDVVNNSGRFYVLKPREELPLDAVYRTGYSNPETGGGGGTRGAALFAEPAASTFDPEKGKLNPIDPEKIALAVGAERHELSIDDRPPDKPPFNPYAATLSFSIGAAKGLAYSVAGAVKGLFYDLPILIGTAGRAYVQLVTERYAELWEAIRDDDDARNVFQRFIDKQKEFMLRDLETAGKVPGKLKQALNAAFEQSQKHLNKLNNKWYNGDWLEAAEELGTDVGQLAGDVALADAALGKILAGLPRLAKVAKVADKAKEKALAKLRPAIETFTARAQNAVRAIRFLAQKVKPGYIFDFEALEVLYGMTHAQARYLAVLAKTEGILIACRSRGAGALKWIEKHNALLKPEWIKTKNVNKYDVEYLGYLESDLDRVVIKTDLPSDNDVIAKLDADGVTDAEVRREVLQRLEDRRKELADPTEKGSSAWILEKARTGEVVESPFNWKDNGLNPYAKGKTTKAKFSMVDEPPPGNLMVSVDGGPPRAITGDLDLVALTKADGTPLSNAVHERILRALQGPPMFIQHPETATWHKKGAFEFTAKHNELRKDLPVQFAPDGLARMVKYNSARSFFQSKLNYFVHWEGGYRHLDWLKVPGLGTAG